MDGAVIQGKNSLSILVDVRGVEAWRPLRAVVDSGTTANLISHLVAKELGGVWEPSYTTARGVGSQEIPLFGKSQLTLSIKDDGGKMQEREHLFASTVMEEYDLMLGYPWLLRENPKQISNCVRCGFITTSLPIPRFPRDLARVQGITSQLESYYTYNVKEEMLIFRLDIMQFMTELGLDVPEEWPVATAR